jgi:hypothetical protein
MPWLEIFVTSMGEVLFPSGLELIVIRLDQHLDLS